MKWNAFVMVKIEGIYKSSYEIKLSYGYFVQ